LFAAGAVVFPEGLESSLAFAGQMLVMLNVAPSQVEVRLNEIRAQDYVPLRAFFHTSEGERSIVQVLDFPQQMRSVLLSDGHHAARRTAHELRLKDLGVKLVDVKRGAIRVPGRLFDWDECVAQAIAGVQGARIDSDAQGLDQLHPHLL
jgi:CPA2 family monovalent cation:H+ antiporter-2